MRPGPSPRKRKPPSDGTVEVFVADEQDEQPVDVDRWSRLVEKVLAAQGVRGAAELSVMFVTEEAMTGLNERFMDSTGPTDVLSFPLDADLDPADVPDEFGPLLLGDVVVCPAVAAPAAPTHAGNLDDELALLVVHGVLHLCGHDHETDDGEMLDLQARIMEEIGETDG